MVGVEIKINANLAPTALEFEMGLSLVITEIYKRYFNREYL